MDWGKPIRFQKLHFHTAHIAKTLNRDKACCNRINNFKMPNLFACREGVFVPNMWFVYISLREKIGTWFSKSKALISLSTRSFIQWTSQKGLSQFHVSILVLYKQIFFIQSSRNPKDVSVLLSHVKTYPTTFFILAFLYFKLQIFGVKTKILIVLLAHFPVYVKKYFHRKNSMIAFICTET